MRWEEMADGGRKSGGVVMRGDMGGGKGGNKGGCCGVPWVGGWMMNVFVVGRDDGCLLSGGDGVRGEVVFTFFLAGLVGRGLRGF